MEPENNHNTWTLVPAEPEQSGEGLPYAPQNWPNVGDVWGWRTGRRSSFSTGCFNDRYLYLPPRLRHERNSGFPSKRAVERYIEANFPHVPPQLFFASFSWRIPFQNSGKKVSTITLIQLEPEEEPEPELPSDSAVCKAMNTKCSSLILEENENKSPALLPCDICCAEPGFCRDCCCILCSKTVDSDHGGYSYIKCLAKKVGDNICGHVAHLECALRIYLAGTVGGSIGLDAEYCCRRCDGRTDMVSHVNKMLQTCQALDLHDKNKIEEKILNLCYCLLRGSQKANANELLSHILNKFPVIAQKKQKVKSGTNGEDISIVNYNSNAQSAVNESPSEVRIGTETPFQMSKSVKLEIEVDQILEALRKSQENEYKLAEEKLHAHKRYLQDLYLQMDYESFDYDDLRDSTKFGNLIDTVEERKEQIRLAVEKFEDMKNMVLARHPKKF